MDKLISLQNVIEILENKRFETGKDLAKSYLLADVQEQIERLPAAFDKEKVIEEIKSWEKASHDAGIQSNYAGLDNKASGYYQESLAYHRSVEIVKKGGIE